MKLLIFMMCIVPCYRTLCHKGNSFRSVPSDAEGPVVCCQVFSFICWLSLTFVLQRGRKIWEAKVFLLFFLPWKFPLLQLSHKRKEHYKLSCLVIGITCVLCSIISSCASGFLHTFCSSLFFWVPWSSILCVACLVLSECFFSPSLYHYYLMCYPLPKHVVSASALTTAGWIQARYHTLMWTWRLWWICHLKFVREIAWKGRYQNAISELNIFHSPSKIAN